MTFVLFFIVLFGYMLVLNNKFKVDFFLVPLVVITSITSIMYVCGLLNIMPFACFITTIMGILLFFKNIFLFDYKKLVDIKLPVIFIVILLGYIMYYCANGIYADGDTLTHWGIIVREMFYENHLPNFATSAISYTSYPPGTACWIYFVQKLIGYSEGKALFAQSLWMLSCAFSIFSFNRSRNVINDLIIGIFCIFVLFYSGLDSLTVDIILPLVFIGALSVIFNYKETLLDARFLFLPFAIVLPIIKNSGILFALFLLPFFFCCFTCYAVSYPNKDRITLIMHHTLLVCTSFFLWSAHTKMVYTNAGTSRHSMSIEYMRSIAESRGIDDIKSITINFFKSWFGWNASYEWLFFLGLTIIIFIILIGGGPKQKKEQKVSKQLTYIIVFEYLFYKLMLLGMYLFNMPGEYDGLPSYNRYQLTFSIIVLFLCVFLYLLSGNVVEKRKGYIQIGILGIMIIYASLWPSRLSIQKPDYKNDGKYRKIVKLIDENDELFQGQKAFLYSDSWLDFFYCRFAFRNQGSFSTTELTDVEEVLTENVNNYDCIILLVQDEGVRKLISKYGYEPESNIIMTLNN